MGNRQVWISLDSDLMVSVDMALQPGEFWGEDGGERNMGVAVRVTAPGDTVVLEAATPEAMVVILEDALAKLRGHTIPAPDTCRFCGKEIRFVPEGPYNEDRRIWLHAEDWDHGCEAHQWATPTNTTVWTLTVDSPTAGMLTSVHASEEDLETSMGERFGGYVATELNNHEELVQALCDQGFVIKIDRHILPL